MAFRVGQKVVCVDDHDTYHVKAGSIYEVEGVRGIYLVLVGIADRGPGRDPGMFKTRFRPVQSTDTGMAILEQIRRDVTNKILRPIFEDEQA
jgi:hypothetical protein